MDLSFALESYVNVVRHFVLVSCASVDLDSVRGPYEVRVAILHHDVGSEELGNFFVCY